MTKVGPARFDAGKKERREGASDPETTKSDKFDFPTSICSAPLLLLPRFRFDSETLSLSHGSSTQVEIKPTNCQAEFTILRN